MFSVLDLDQLQRAQVYREPFPYGVISRPVQPQFRDRLLAEFPTCGFEKVEKSSQGKKYRMYHRTFIDKRDGSAKLDGLASIWGELYRDLTSPLYRSVVAELTGTNLENCSIGASFWRYEHQCFLSTHTDKPEKVVTQLIYLEDEWDESWGGCLHLHREGEGYPIFRTIKPMIDQSVLLVRTDNSWHSVSPVVKGERNRKSLQIVFWK